MRTGPIAPSKHTAKSSRPLALEQLEDRDVPAIVISISYAYDASGFFTNNPTARATLQLAANDLASAINTSLAAITPSGTNTWTESFYSPSTGQEVTVNDPAVPANTIVVYAGSRALGSSQASQGAFGGYSISGTQAWVNALQSRSPGWGSLLWGGSIAFDSTVNWYFGSSASGIAANQEDFFTCATHELAHVLGMGTSPLWFSHVSGNTFVGAHSRALYGAPLPLTWGSTELNNVTMKGVPAVLNLNLPMGVRTAPFTTIDWAILQDMGWSVSIPATPAPPTITSPVAVPPPSQSAPTAPVLVSGSSNGAVSAYSVASSGALTATGQAYTPFPGYGGVIRTAVGDFTQTGLAEDAFVTGSGVAAELKIINPATGATILAPTKILGGFTGGAFVTAADLSGNGIDDVIVSEDAGGQPLVQVYQVVSGQLKPVAAFQAFGSSMTSGVRLAAGDIAKNGIDDLVVSSGAGSAPWVEIYSGASLARGQPTLLAPAFLAFPATATAGVNVAVGDVTGDGYSDLIVSQDAGGSSLVEIWSGAVIAANTSKPISSLATYLEFYGNGSLNTGMRIATRVVNGVTELVTAPASGAADWIRTLTLTSSSVTPSAAVFPFGSGTTLDGVYVG
jgi:hypothetical protein